MRWLPVLLVLLPIAAQGADAPRQANLSAMGGIPINVSAWGIEQAGFDQAVADIAARIEELEAMISTYRADSEVSRLNRGEKLESTPAELTHLVRAANAISAETAGAFDITVQPLVELWRTCRREQRLPGNEEYAAALACVGYSHVEVGMSGVIMLGQEGVMLDLGGIAKGYFADEAVAILRRAGATRCLVDVGGDIVTWQEQSAGAVPFRVGIKHPRNSGKILAILEVPTGSVVTSGSYERFYEIEGKRFCHIFDPRTGKPVAGMLSVTLTAPTGLDADALATAVFVMGLQTGREFVEASDWLEALIIAEGEGDGMEIYVSPGLVERVEFLSLEQP